MCLATFVLIATGGLLAVLGLAGAILDVRSARQRQAQLAGAAEKVILVGPAWARAKAPTPGVGAGPTRPQPTEDRLAALENDVRELRRHVDDRLFEVRRVAHTEMIQQVDEVAKRLDERDNKVLGYLHEIVAEGASRKRLFFLGVVGIGVLLSTTGSLMSLWVSC